MTDSMEHERAPVELPLDWLADFCRRWQIAELGLFGSGARGELRDDSDLDFLVSFLPQAKPSLMDVVNAEFELEDKLQRPVDLVIREGLKNPIRRRAILRDLIPLYAA